MKFDLKPSPKVLVALTHTSMKPIDALCELIDNAIDSFSNSNDDLQKMQEINIILPTLTELQKGEGVLRVSDNGPGMTAEEAKNALTAGYSSQNVYDRLGMFGMGLNIAAGKFARKTRLITATKNDPNAIIVDVDLDVLVKQKHYQVNAHKETKSKYFERDASGTIIELSNWWRQGSPNSENSRILARYGPRKIREILGRRYATLLRSNSSSRFKILVKEDPCVPFEHCVWGENRFVKKGSSKIYALQVFDERIRTQKRCHDCGELANEEGLCPADRSHVIRSVDERVHGWVGVQRYDHTSHYGIDLIRNGRAIRLLEKDAFFTFTKDDGESIKDYPIDSIYGRIVGEVHLNHIRVDFTKQDFDRSTSEWQRAMKFLRGESSLQTKQPGSGDNDSPVMRIFRGYRRIRNFGLSDMYMGEKQSGTDKKAKRIDRKVEEEFLQRFYNKEEGYYDDAKWWEKVEEASKDYDEGVESCPECEAQNLATVEICGACGYLLKTKECIKCGEKIARSAQVCDHCEEAQVPEGPWECKVCQNKNSPDSDECEVCGKVKGAVNPFAPDVLLANASKDEGLSVDDIQINFSNGEKNQKFELETWDTQLRSSDYFLPSIVDFDQTQRKLRIFLDKSHPVFKVLQLHPEHAVAAEAAAWIRMESVGSLSGHLKIENNLAVIQNKLLEKYWKDNLSDDPGQVRDDMRLLLEDMRAKIVENMKDISDEVFNSMSALEQSEMVESMQESNVDIAEMGKLKEKGTFLLYVPPETVVSIFRNHPGRFFDKTVWNSPWDIPGLSEESTKVTQKQLKETYLNCLEDGIRFLRYKTPLPVVVRRVRMSIEFLQQDFID